MVMMLAEAVVAKAVEKVVGVAVPKVLWPLLGRMVRLPWPTFYWYMGHMCGLTLCPD